MAKKNEIKYEDLLEFVKGLPYNQFRDVINHYASHNDIDFEKDKERLVTTDLQQRLEVLGVNTACPYCECKEIKVQGYRNHIKRFRCKNCSKTFTLFSGTILEKTKWHWDIWCKVLEMTINHLSLETMENILVKDYGCIGINIKTIFLWRHKLIHSLALLPQPVLSGVVQVDETFIRESQKGSKMPMINYIDNGKNREPRYGRQPSKMGVMGPEFATVVTAIDNKGYCVCKVSSLGRLTVEVFTDLFEKHLDKPAFVCSDANNVYELFCNAMEIPHYIKPSNYMAILEKNGYFQPIYTDKVLAEKVKINNEKVLETLYNKRLIDKINHREKLTYKEFNGIKRDYKLSLARVNELHSDIKRYIYGRMANVSSKYLSDYIGFFTYIRNWRVSKGFYPTSSKDAEGILIEILKNKNNYTKRELSETKLQLPKPSSRYMTILKAYTTKIRQATANEYFKFDEEDNVLSFDKKKFLGDTPQVQLYEIAKKYGIGKYKKMALGTLIGKILDLPDIEFIIYEIITSNRHYLVGEEDLQAIREVRFNKGKRVKK